MSHHVQTEDGQYRVPPFSKRDRSRRFRVNPDVHGECAICCRPVVLKTVRHWAVVVDGGASWGDAQADQDDPGYMGMFPVGNTCHNRYLRAH
jgi:hypothetical protein